VSPPRATWLHNSVDPVDLNTVELTLTERQDISRQIASGSSIREVSSCCEPQVAGYRCEEIGVGLVAISLLAQQDRRIYRERTLRRNPGRY
jgi:hypothetical protein